MQLHEAGVGPEEAGENPPHPLTQVMVPPAANGVSF